MKNEISLRIFSSIILIPIVFYLIIKGSIVFSIFLLLCYLISIYEWNKITKKKSFKLIGFIFLSFSFFATFLLRNYELCCDNYNFGLKLFLLILIICIFTDIGGYIFGKILKGPNLTKISPNKTYSGMFGGYFLSIFVALLISKFMILNISFSFKLIFFAFLISTVSQIGDITISYFKRLNNIKDTGSIIPGHGGILDRIDGMIFAYPFSYLIIIFKIFEF